jgi:hypothetical protein
VLLPFDLSSVFKLQKASRAGFDSPQARKVKSVLYIVQLTVYSTSWYQSRSLEYGTSVRREYSSDGLDR